MNNIPLFAVILIGGLSSWRWAYMLVIENGPGDIFAMLRHVIGIRPMLTPEGIPLKDDNDNPIIRTSNVFAEALTCVWCTSVWVGVILTVALAIFPANTWLYINLPFVFSAIAVVINSAVNVLLKAKG